MSKKKEAEKTVRIKPLPKGARPFKFKCNTCGFTADVSGKSQHEALNKAFDAHEDHHLRSGSFCLVAEEANYELSDA